MRFGSWVLGIVILSGQVQADETPAARGKKALEGRAFTPPSMTRQAYDRVWKQWGLKEKPPAAEYDRLFRERYGFHPAPYPNDGMPMGLRQASLPFGLGTGISMDCLICHGGSINGQSYVGLGNTALEIQAFFEEMARADGRKGQLPFHFGNMRGTSEAGAMAVFLIGYREPDLTVRLKYKDYDLQDDLCEDVPAWWLLKKKKSMYYTGATDARSVRSIMQFMMSPLNGPDTFAREEATFRDIRAHILSLQPPKYPLPIDRELAHKGETLFNDQCAKCHGTYGDQWTYPNRIVPIAEIGTDRRRYDGISKKFGEIYNKSWFAQERTGWLGDEYPVRETVGYQAPPLDGIWATAPYLHNGSVPTLYKLLNSKARPRVFTRSYRTDLDVYDSREVGWKVQTLSQSPNPTDFTSEVEFRKIYDTTQKGRGNQGHIFGDKLTDEERWAVIEYLKGL